MLMQPRLRSEENVADTRLVRNLASHACMTLALTFSNGLHQHMSAAFAVAWQRGTHYRFWE